MSGTGVLRIHGARGGVLTVSIHDLTGRAVRVLDPVTIGSAGDVALPIDLGDLASGAYTIEALADGARAITRVIVVR